VDDGRLELDDDGRVLDGRVLDGHELLEPRHAVDLADPAATEQLAASRADAWVSGSLLAWLGRHRRPVSAAVVSLAAVALGTAWWVSRPAPPAPAPPVSASDAVLDGSDLGGPRLDDTGDLAVAYTVRASVPGTSFEVVALTGPGLTPVDVRTGAGQVSGAVTHDADLRVEAHAVVRCDDPAIAGARASDYALQVLPTGASSGTPAVVVPFGDRTTRLDVAVRDLCLTSTLPREVSVVDAHVDPSPGSSVVSLRLVVRNNGTVPVSVATERRDDGTVEVDQSQTAVLKPGGSALLTTRMLVHDCTTQQHVGSVLDDPNPVVPNRSPDPLGLPGVTVRLTLGDQSGLASYPLPTTTTSLSKALGLATCSGRPTVAVDLESTEGTRAPDGSWYVDALLLIRTSGIGISVGREHFAGPAWGSGSTLVTGGPATPGSPWSIDPVQLDGGAGHLVVRFMGSTCASAGATAPDHLALRVIDSTRTSFPFEVALDAPRLQAAVDAACSAAFSPTS